MILSDSHGLKREVIDIVQHFSVNQILHCGDFCVEATLPPFATMVKVRGNCDFAIDVPLKKVLDWQGLKVVMVHGHKFRVKESPLALTYMGKQEGAHIVLFGHSHQPVTFMDNGTLYLNPGSIYRPRGYKTPTFVIATIEKSSSEFTIKVDYYNLDYEIIDELSGEYHLTK